MLTVFSLIYSFWTVNAQELKSLQLDGLEIDIPQNYKVNSHMIDGVLQTSLRKSGGGMTTVMVVSIADLEYHLSIEELRESLFELSEGFRQPGFTMEPFMACSMKSLNGFRTEGTATMLGEDCKIVVKVFAIGNYYVQFIEYYGEDFSSEYQSIEESLRISAQEKPAGMQTIKSGGYSFAYDADRIRAIANNQGDETTFTFTSTIGNEGDNFLEYNFLPVQIDNFYAYSIEWFKKMEAKFKSYFATYESEPMERVTFLGQPGYMKTASATIANSGMKVKFTVRVCRYNNQFTWSAMQLTLDNNMLTSVEIEEMFESIESTLKFLEE